MSIVDSGRCARGRTANLESLAAWRSMLQRMDARAIARGSVQV